MEPVQVGVVGCGAIADIYLANSHIFESFEVIAVADRDDDRARAKAKQHSIRRCAEVDTVLALPDIELILNLTTPSAHGDIAMRALTAGKSVYNEKPLAMSRDDALEMLNYARNHELRVGCAPDTFMGAGLQTCRGLIDDGALGEPIAATAFYASRGHEHWHPNPEFFYKPGGGPLFDMGPYYITALVSLLGPVHRVSGTAKTSFRTRTITSQPRAGDTMRVDTPTHLSATLEFVDGAVATMIMSFDVMANRLPLLEIHGTAASLSAPDPNTFGGDVQLRGPEEAAWQLIKHTHAYAAQERGLGVADMAAAMRSGRPHRANGELAFHVLDVMQSILESSERGEHVVVVSRCERPAPMERALVRGRLDP